MNPGLDSGACVFFFIFIIVGFILCGIFIKPPTVMITDAVAVTNQLPNVRLIIKVEQ